MSAIAQVVLLVKNTAVSCIYQSHYGDMYCVYRRKVLRPARYRICEDLAQ